MTKQQSENRFRMIERLKQYGFTFDECESLRRIEMTLQRWSELECGNGNDRISYAIERDPETDKPFMVYHPNIGKSYKMPVADREKGALKRLQKIIDARNGRVLDGNDVVAYHQGDPRGCALYILKTRDLEDGERDLPIDQYYNRGIAICS